MRAHTGLISHRLRSSRPPLVPMFQRYYLDIGLLIIGALVFWEFRARGELVSEGLLGDSQVNEATLLAPVLFLVVVALLFMRFFPLIVRFMSGESPGILHLLLVGSVAAIGPTIAVKGIRDDTGLGWIGVVLLLLALSAIYRETNRAQRRRFVFFGLAVQAGAVAWFLTLEPPSNGEALFIPKLVLLAIVPAQIIFLIIKSLVQAAPVWLSMSLWHMARNPFQYSWLVLLLVLVTGLGVLSTTVGGTLDRSHQERIKYGVAGDFRVAEIPGYFARTEPPLKERYSGIPGVIEVSLARRGEGVLGSTSAGTAFDVLAGEAQEFSNIAWYREDFSATPLRNVMQLLGTSDSVEPRVIPDGATGIGVWVKPQDFYPIMSLWLVIKDSRGKNKVVTLGNTGAPRWHLMSAEIPTELEPSANFDLDSGLRAGGRLDWLYRLNFAGRHPCDGNRRRGSHIVGRFRG